MPSTAVTPTRRPRRFGWKHRLIGGGIACLALTGALTANTAVNSPERADAWTKYNCQVTYPPYGGYWYLTAYIDYNWWEESNFGGAHRDGRETVSTCRQDRW